MFWYELRNKLEFCLGVGVGVGFVCWLEFDPGNAVKSVALDIWVSISEWRNSIQCRIYSASNSDMIQSNSSNSSMSNRGRNIILIASLWDNIADIISLKVFLSVDKKIDKTKINIATTGMFYHYRRQVIQTVFKIMNLNIIVLVPSYT